MVWSVTLTLHTMTEGICYVFDSLKLASVINSELLMNFLVFEKKYL